MATKPKASEELVDVSTGEIVAADVVAQAKGMGDFVPKSWEDMEEFFASEGGILTFEGSAYMVIEKEKLVGQPFMIADVRIWHSSKFDSDVASVMLITKTPIDDRDHFVINDGSTGIFEQVTGMIARSGRKSGILCPNGLRASTYTKELIDPFEPDAPPKQIEATTYYVQ